jgi:uracil-DNA glycosylase family 4
MTREAALRDMVEAKGLTYVGTRGTPGDPVVVVGEAPGIDEERLGLPFVGASGRELGRMFQDAGWEGRWGLVGAEKIFVPSSVWYTNVYKIRPPENKVARIGEYGIPLDAFRDYFIEELRTYRPKIIIATGNTALGVLCEFTLGKAGQARIGTYRGSLLKSNLLEHDHYVIPCYHPAFILREWSERPVGVFCIERAREEYLHFQRTGALQPLPERLLRVQPDYPTVFEYLKSCLEPVPQRVSIDIEMLGQYPYTIAIARSPTDACAFSLVDYPDRELAKIWILLREVLRACPQIGQNYIGFDCTWLEYLGLDPDLSKVEDTMILHHILWPELPHRLQFLALQYTREPYWKDEGKKWKSKHGLAPLLRYNALDAAVTYEVMLAMEKELEERAGTTETAPAIGG